MPMAASSTSRPIGPATRSAQAVRASVRIDHDRAVADRPAAHAAEHDQGIGRRGIGAAAPVACRARRGAGALRAAAQHAGAVDRRDGAAAGAHRVNVDGRQGDVVAAQHEAVDELGAATLQHADVAARAADLHGDQVVAAAQAAVVAHGADAGRRAGQAKPGRRLGDAAEADGAAIALDQRHLAAESELAQFLAQRLEIGRHAAADIGVDDRGRAALVFADDRRQAGRQRDRHLRRRARMISAACSSWAPFW